MAEVAEGALRLFSARVRGSPYCGVQPLSVTTPIAEKFARHAWPRRARSKKCEKMDKVAQKVSTFFVCARTAFSRGGILIRVPRGIAS